MEAKPLRTDARGLPLYPPLNPGVAATLKRMLARAGLTDWRTDWRTTSQSTLVIHRNLMAPDAATRAHAHDCAVMAYCRKESRCDLLPQAYAADVELWGAP